MGETKLHSYKVGMGSDTKLVRAQSPAAAALYYGLFCVDTNNPFMTVVYEVDGEPYQGKNDWLILNPTESDLLRIIEPIADQIRSAELVS